MGSVVLGKLETRPPFLSSSNYSRDLPSRSSREMSRRNSPTSVKDAETTFAEGFIFLCNDETQDECFSRWLFGSPHRAIDDMERSIGRGTKLFLLNISSRCIYGPYYAAAKPQLQIKHNAFRSRFPAQVPVRPYGRDQEMDARQLSWKPKSGALSANRMKELLVLWNKVAESSTATPAVVENLKNTFATKPSPSRTTTPNATTDLNARMNGTSASATKASWADDCESESDGGDSEEATPSSFTTAASEEAGEPNQSQGGSLALKMEAIAKAVRQRQADLQVESAVLGEIRTEMNQLAVLERNALEPVERQLNETDGSIAELVREFERVTLEFKQRKENLRNKRALLMDEMETMKRGAKKEKEEKMEMVIKKLQEEGITLPKAEL